MFALHYICLSFLLVLFIARQDALAQDVVTQATPRPASETPKLSAGTKLSLHFVDADLHDVLRILAEEGNCNLVVTDDVQGRVTLRFNDVTWAQALDTIVLAYGLAIRQQDNTVFIGYAAGE